MKIIREPAASATILPAVLPQTRPLVAQDSSAGRGTLSGVGAGAWVGVCRPDDTRATETA